ncbi:MAG TPA: DUF4340 domain-containing protein [Sphingomonadales bacterium]|nr:DUF4340 domain-containing protein [Sphingomonadales bacterium]
MKIARATLALGLVAAASLGLAIWLNWYGAAPPPAIPGAGEPLIPGAAALTQAASEIHVRSPKARTTLKLGEQGWGIVEKDGYPAHARKVAALLEALARAEKVEPKTDGRARFPRMGLGSAATTLSLYDGAGALLFSFDTGLQFPDAASGRLLTYAFYEGLERAWTASAFPPLDTDPMFWAERDVVSISPARIKRVRVAFGESQGVALSRAEADGVLFDARELEGRGNVAAVNALAFALQDLETEDVAGAGTLELFEVASAVFTTFDGLEVTLRFFDSEGVVWTAVAAAYRPGVLEETDTPNVLPDAPPDGAAEAAALHARLAGWLFRLPLAKVSAILKTEDALRTDAR